MNKNLQKKLYNIAGNLAMPLVAICGRGSSGEMGLALVASVVLWPVTLPFFLVFGPIAAALEPKDIEE